MCSEIYKVSTEDLPIGIYPEIIHFYHKSVFILLNSQKQRLNIFHFFC